MEQREIEGRLAEDRPLFEVASHFLTVSAFWAALTVGWTKVRFENGEIPVPVALGLIVITAFHLFLTWRFLRLAGDLSNHVEARWNASGKIHLRIGAWLLKWTFGFAVIALAAVVIVTASIT